MSRESGTRNQTATDRREAVIDAAIAEFSLKGLHGTSTEDIARRAGISQPYIFRLFGTKKDLFIAAANRMCDHVAETFRAAVETGSGAPLDRMGEGYTQLLTNRNDLLMLLQTFAASGDVDVQTVIRARFADLFQQARQASGADDEAVRNFFAFGMLLTVLAAIDLPSVLGFATWEAFANCKVYHS